jgi:hypothetical protein
MRAGPPSDFWLVCPFWHFCVAPSISFSTTDETLYLAGGFWSNLFGPDLLKVSPFGFQAQLANESWTSALAGGL